MKPNTMTMKAILVSAIAIGGLSACKPAPETAATAEPAAAVAEAGSATFKDAAAGRAFDAYAKVRAALVASDAAAAKSAAADLAKDDAAAEAAAKEIAASGDIKVQRAAFQRLGQALLPVFQKNLSGGEIHVIHCPMAFDNKGGDWISADTKVRNPYYGKSMLECGEVTKTITP